MPDRCAISVTVSAKDSTESISWFSLSKLVYGVLSGPSLALDFASICILSSRRPHMLYRRDSCRFAARLEKKGSTNAAVVFASGISLESLELCKRYAVLVEKSEPNTVYRL